jgi:hypothetical protein
MAKKKFNREERSAIIAKLKQIANDKNTAAWKAAEDAYVPSETYKNIEKLLTQFNETWHQLKTEFGTVNMEHNWSNREPYDIPEKLKSVRNRELEKVVKKYSVNADRLDVEIILMNQDDPMDKILEHLLENHCK